MIRTATCRCGGCTIEVEGEPVFNQVCHCSSCKRRTGGPYGWIASFGAAQIISRRGKFAVYHSDGTVGAVANSFCSVCGTTLLFEPARFPDIVGCAAGCFADVPLGEPTVSASDDLRCAWLRLPDACEARPSAVARTEQAGRPPAGAGGD